MIRVNLSDTARHIISFSGGKDSTAMLLRMLELKMPVDDIIFADVGMEMPGTYDYIKKVEKHINRKITILRSETNWDELFYGKLIKGKFKGKTRGFPGINYPCWAANMLKVKPLRKGYTSKDICYIGITIDEKHRADGNEYKGKNFRFPLIDWGWTEADCLQYLTERKILNPIYKTQKRTGCWCCPKQNRKSLQILCNDHPDLWKRLKQYEKDSPHGFRFDLKLDDFEKRVKGKTINYGSEIGQTTLLEKS